MSAELVMLILAIILVWGVFGKPEPVVRPETTKKIRPEDVAPLEEGEERAAAEIKNSKTGPPNQVNHYSSEEKTLAVDTFARMKAKSKGES